MSRAVSKEVQAEWESRFLQQKASGLSIAHWCSNNQITQNTFHYWKRRLSVEAPLESSSFVELTDPQDTGITLEFQGVRILLQRGFEAFTLTRCLEALKAVKC
jgi:hypothetical protein